MDCIIAGCKKPAISYGGMCETHTTDWLRSPEYKQYAGSLESCRLGIAAYTKRLNGKS